MAQLEFNLAYDGPAVREGSMPVPVLAPALLSLEALLSDVARGTHPALPTPRLSVRATRRGSFIVDLLLDVQGGWDEGVGLLNSDPVNALVNLMEISTGVFVVIRWLRGRRVVNVEKAEDGQATAELEDGDVETFPPAVLRAAQDPVIRDDAYGVVAPLGEDGVEKMTLASRTPVGPMREATVLAEDLPSFVPEEILLEAKAVLESRDEIMWLEVRHLSFARGNKWRFTDGKRSFSASIDDMQFAQEIEEGRPFRKGDKLRCRVHVVQSERTNGSLHTDYSVRQVLEVRQRAQQLRLDDQGGR